MTDVRPQELIQEIQSELDAQIEDPNPDRNGSPEWIYTVPLQFDIADYPRIHIQQINSTHTGFSVGTGSREADTLIQISIFHSTQDGYKLDIDDDNEVEPINEVIDYIADRVIDVVNNSQTTWRNKGDNIHYVLTTNENRVEAQREDIEQYIVEAEARLTRRT
ncbi:hypothetical protein OSG_eHP23_00050 [environmental Halophage eHP-23]|nr:hypothetical protein OSG_eHP23_00050 [environmental Halophage eHP-23]